MLALQRPSQQLDARKARRRMMPPSSRPSRAPRKTSRASQLSLRPVCLNFTPMITSALLVLLIQAQAPQVPDLSGLWTAALRFGPDVRGTLLVMRTSTGWRADISGFNVPVRLEGGAQHAAPLRGMLSFSLPDRAGDFRGKVVGREIHGHWIQPRTNYNGGQYARPVTLVPDGAAR